MQAGDFARVKGKDFGTGKFIALQADGLAEIAWWFSGDAIRSERVPLADVLPARPARHTRCYYRNPLLNKWEMGRIGDFEAPPNGSGRGVHVLFPERREEWLPLTEVYVRAHNEADADANDPLGTLLRGENETPYFHQWRAPLMDALVTQRGLTRGLSGFASSRIRLLPHQAEIVQRVLEDSVRRYLLADEVGLGKTIEAGAILRQTLLDDPAARALVLVPSSLLAQWTTELESKHGIAVNGSTLTLASQEDYPTNALRNEFYHIVIMDEAHHLAACAYQPENAAIWQAFRDTAHRAPALLLLSATPALHNERAFLAMLHLLEPQSYSLEDLESFEQKVRERQTIGEFLRLFREGERERSLLREFVELMRERFAADPYVLAQAGRLEEMRKQRGAEPWEKIDQLIRETRLHICETHRIFRRMLRTSRRNIAPGSISGLIEARSGASEEGLEDTRLHAFQSYLEAWRVSAVQAFYDAPETARAEFLQSVLRLFLDLIELSNSGLPLVLSAIHCRLTGREIPSASINAMRLENTTAKRWAQTPLYDGERELLEQVARKLEGAPEEDEADAIDTLIALLHNNWRARSNQPLRRKVLVFTAQTAAGEAIKRRIQAEMQSAIVLSHFASDSVTERAAALARFTSVNNCAVLLCDSTGEEGLNLQMTDLLLHFDLPWEPNRIEQRMGRVDRIGRMAVLPCRVLLPGSDAPAFADVWFTLLRDGFGVFRQSIADLQFFTDRERKRLAEVAFFEGVNALKKQKKAVQEGLEAERRRISDQDALDEIETFENDDTVYASLTRAEDAALTLQRATDGWVVNALKFEPELAMGDLWHRDNLRPHFRYLPNRDTLLPEYKEGLWEAQAKMAGVAGTNAYVTFSREEALKRGDTGLLRIGHPFIDQIAEILQREDRGQAFALWRYAPCPPASKWMGDFIFLRFDYLVEADLSPALALIKETEGANPNFEERYSIAKCALSRRADGWFTPQRKTIFLTQSLQQASKSLAEKRLALPYLKEAGGGYRDYSLNLQRRWALDAILAPMQYASLLKDGREVSERLLRESPESLTLWQASKARAQKVVEQRLNQLSRGLVFSRFGSSSGAREQADIQAVVAAEKALNQALLTGVTQPRIRLDAVGLIALSSRNPFAEEDSD